MRELVLVMSLLCAIAHAQDLSVCIAAFGDDVSFHTAHQLKPPPIVIACRTAMPLLLLRPPCAAPPFVSPNLELTHTPFALLLPILPKHRYSVVATLFSVISILISNW
jgi:hypothetical protein